MMTPEHVDRLMGLGIVLLVSVGALWLLLRVTAAEREGSDWIVGYPPARFPARELTSSGPLASLVAIQLRLLTLFNELPAGSEASLWLRPFLAELRTIMDRAYKVAVITRLYGRPAALDRLTREVEQMEQQVAEHVTARLLAPAGSEAHDALSEQLAMLRLCVDQLAFAREPELEEMRQSPHS